MLEQKHSRIKIRQAVFEDMDWLVSELLVFASEFGTKKLLFGEDDYVREKLADMMDHHLFLVAEREGELMGLICGLVVPAPIKSALETFISLSLPCGMTRP